MEKAGFVSGPLHKDDISQRRQAGVQLAANGRDRRRISSIGERALGRSVVTPVGTSSSDRVDARITAIRLLHRDIRGRWPRFTDFELGALANTEDLVNQVAIKYGLERARARSEVANLLKGRKV